MSEFVLFKDEDGDVIGCSCCGYEAPTSLFDAPLYRETTEKDRLCEVCACTLIASAYQYPRQHLEDGNVLKCMAQCTNMILEAIRAEKK